MRLDAVRAVFYSIEHLKVAPAFFAESIKRAIAEETVEILFVQPLMTWKVFALLVIEESAGFVFHSHLSFIRCLDYTTEAIRSAAQANSEYKYFVSFLESSV